MIPCFVTTFLRHCTDSTVSSAVESETNRCFYRILNTQESVCVLVIQLSEFVCLASCHCWPLSLFLPPSLLLSLSLSLSLPPTEPQGFFSSSCSDWSQQSLSPEIALILLGKIEPSSNPLLQFLPSLPPRLPLSLPLSLSMGKRSF